MSSGSVQLNMQLETRIRNALCIPDDLQSPIDNKPLNITDIEPNVFPIFEPLASYLTSRLISYRIPHQYIQNWQIQHLFGNDLLQELETNVNPHVFQILTYFTKLENDKPYYLYSRIHCDALMVWQILQASNYHCGFYEANHLPYFRNWLNRNSKFHS